MHYVLFFSSLLAPALQALVINNQSNEQPKQLVILRSYNPHAGMLHRMQLYFADIKENMPGSRFLISVDTTKKNKTSIIKQHLPDADLHIYDSSVVAEAYKGIPYSPYSWHMEPLNLAAKYAVDHFGIAFDYIWMVEDDVVICGGITNLMFLFAGNSAGLIGGMPGVGQVEGWAHRDEGTNQFLERYPAFKRRHGFEQIMRFSNKLLERLHELSYAEGVSAQSEMFSYTVAYNENYTIDIGLEENYGKMCWRCQISKQEEVSLCETAEQEGTVTINHAGKSRRLAAE